MPTPPVPVPQWKKKRQHLAVLAAVEAYVMLIPHVLIHAAQLQPQPRYDSKTLECGLVFSTTPLIKTSSLPVRLWMGGLPAGVSGEGKRKGN